MSDSIFTQIIRGEIPSHKIYEDEKTFVFLDIHPVQPGHTLVVPKIEIEFLWDLDQETYEAVMSTAHKVALRLRQVFDKPYVGMKVVGIDVPHAHVHLIPFSTLNEFNDVPEPTSEPYHERLSAIAKKLAF
ncbi:MAG TPA: HIT family protein [Candidatus Saccharimonadales bacterium]|nr:HIT family protein [Candidatus Saccharimonadales bacterium]